MIAFDPGCTGKEAYTSLSAAQARLRAQERGHRVKQRNGRGRMTAYKCQCCGCCHVGSGAL